tara:strand:- start:212 stop:499 length:288 start_codon:yes stop_codon:yes gene_type:complete
MSIELNEFLSLKGDQGMKNILFCPKKPKITKKRAWGEYLHPYGTYENLGCRFSSENGRNLDFGPGCRSVPLGCKYSSQALFGQVWGSFMHKEAFS